MEDQRMNDSEGEGMRAYNFGMVLLEAGKTDDAIKALVRAEKLGCDRATSALDSMVSPLPGEHPISLENRRAAIRHIGA
jgi:hypothetical protein